MPNMRMGLCHAHVKGLFGKMKHSAELAHGANRVLDIAMKLLEPIEGSFCARNQDWKRRLRFEVICRLLA